MSVARTRLHEAIDLVQRDVEAELGHGAVDVAVIEDPGFVTIVGSGNPDLLDMITDPRMRGSGDELAAWIYVRDDGGAVGLSLLEEEPFWQLLQRVADTVQQVVMESGRFFGLPFPRCPVHHTHPLWTLIRGSDVMWGCRTDDRIAVPVGPRRAARLEAEPVVLGSRQDPVVLGDEHIERIHPEASPSLRHLDVVDVDLDVEASRRRRQASASLSVNRPPTCRTRVSLLIDDDEALAQFLREPTREVMASLDELLLRLIVVLRNAPVGGPKPTPEPSLNILQQVLGYAERPRILDRSTPAPKGPWYSVVRRECYLYWLPVPASPQQNDPACSRPISSCSRSRRFGS